MAVGVSIRGLAQTLKKTLGGASSPAADWWGTVQTVNTGPPPSVTATVNGTASVVTAQYGSAYASAGPQMGDVVFGRTDGEGDYWVVDCLATTAVGPIAGLTPIGMAHPSPYAISDPAWLLLNGGTFSSTTYPALYVINGSSTTLPDWRGVAPMGAGVNGIVLGTLDLSGGSEAHTHTGAAHTHTGAAHLHGSGGPHTHTTEGTVGAAAAAGSAVGAPSGATSTGSTDPGNTASTTPGAGGSTTPGSGGSYGTGTANIPPNIGVNWYVRAL